MLSASRPRSNFDFDYVDTGGARLRYVSKGRGLLVLFVHGFPESWYSWRHQLEPVAEAGFRAVAVDVRGYGGSTKRFAVPEYSMAALTADMAGAAQALSPDEPAIIIGHDWGAPIAWTSALLYPERFRAVAGLSIPHAAPSEEPTDEVHDRIFTKRGKWFYQVDFQQEGIAEAELEADPAETILRFYYALSGDVPEGSWPADKSPGDGLLKGLADPPPELPWLTREDLAYYAAEFDQSGFRGPLNRYRNRRRDWEMLSARRSHIIPQPSLFIGGTRDLGTAMAPQRVWDELPALLPDLRGHHMLEGCGHWTQQERPEEVNDLLLGWLASL